MIQVNLTNLKAKKDMGAQKRRCAPMPVNAHTQTQIHMHAHTHTH